MNNRLQSGFVIGDWEVHPQENLLRRGDASKHLEPKVMDVLVFLAERQGEVISRLQLLDAVWAGVVVGDETLSRAVSILRNELGDDPRSPRYLQTISKRGYRCIAEVAPLASSGTDHARSGDAQDDMNAIAQSGRKTTRSRPVNAATAVILALLVAAAVFGLLEVFRTDDAPAMRISEGSPSIAVLPFANRSTSEEDVFFVDGIHDELLSHVARIGSIKTISATSVRQYRGTTKTIPQIARELGVTAVLEGGVQRAGDQVRINVQLIDAVTDEHLWAQIYDRKLTAENIFVIQSEIATAIAQALNATLSTAEQGRINAIPTQNLAALEAYFLGNQSLERRTTVELEKAKGHFKEAIRLDPGFALAYVGLADTYRLQSSYGDLPFAEANVLGQAAVDRALELDDQLGEAYVSLANLLRRADDFAAADAAFKKGLELKPNYASAYHWYGEFLALEVGRPLEALDYSSTAIELDPFSPILNTDHAEALDAAGRFDEALSYYARAIEIDPGFAVAHAQAGTVYWLGLGQVDEAISWYAKAERLDPGSPYIPAILGLAYLDLGEEALGARWIERSFGQAPERFLINSAMARLFLYRGNEARAIEYAHETVALNAGALYAVAILSSSDLKAGRGADARTRYETGFPTLAAAEPEINAENYEAAADFALVLSRIGDHEQAELLQGRTMEYIRDKPRMGYRGYWITDVKIHAQRGDWDKALAALREAFEAGWRHYWWYYFDHDMSLEPLHDNPEYLAIREDLVADMQVQAARLRAAGAPQAPTADNPAE